MFEILIGFVVFLPILLLLFLSHKKHKIQASYEIFMEETKQLKKQLDREQSQKTINKIVFYVNDFFDNDHQKVYEWFTTPNPNFGEITPYDMIKYGKEKRLLEFIEHQYFLSGKTLIQ
jgi:uncharacterized protein (DUF2384 family)